MAEIHRATIRVDGKHLFEMKFTQGYAGGPIEIWAITWPPNPHSNLYSMTHVNPETGKLCVGCAQPQRLERARAIAKLWATSYVEFIKTGTFPNAGGKVNV